MDRPEQDREAILAAMGHLSHGVYVLGSRRGREMTAMTASWVAQVSERPPCVVVSVRDDRYTHDVILESATFSLSVLREDQVDVATHFAETSGEYHDKLHGVPYGQSPGGSPVLLDCLAYLDCRVLDSAHAGDHTVFIGEVTAGESYDGPSYPLLYDPSEYEGALSQVRGEVGDRLKELGYELPSVPNPAGSYVPATSAGLLVFTAGQLPFKEGQLRYIGKVDKDVSVEEAKEAARLCALNALAALEAEAGSLDNARIVKVTGYVASAADFNRQPEVINGASDLLSEVFGERGTHARSAVGVSELPLDAPVEVELIVEVTLGS